MAKIVSHFSQRRCASDLVIPRYNAVNFLENHHNRRHMGRPWKLYVVSFVSSMSGLSSAAAIVVLYANIMMYLTAL